MRERDRGGKTSGAAKGLHEIRKTTFGEATTLQEKKISRVSMLPASNLIGEEGE